MKGNLRKDQIQIFEDQLSSTVAIYNFCPALHMPDVYSGTFKEPLFDDQQKPYLRLDERYGSICLQIKVWYNKMHLLGGPLGLDSA